MNDQDKLRYPLAKAKEKRKGGNEKERNDERCDFYLRILEGKKG